MRLAFQPWPWLATLPAASGYGSDTNSPTISGSPPYAEPYIGGTYGGYLGRIGTWLELFGCPEASYMNVTDVKGANTNFYNYHGGVGTGVYWDMAGPGLDPKFDGTTGEAYTWGEEQAQQAQYDLKNFLYPTPFAVMWMDIESDGGWNHVYKENSNPTCTWSLQSTGIADEVDRYTFDGFWDWISHNTSGYPGAYSYPDFWGPTFGSYGTILGTYEWTSQAQTSLTPGPSGWCEGGTCAQFFGGQSSSSSHAVAWQWCITAADCASYGDFDQIDANNLPTGF